jgi:hypothetical protein
MRREAKLLLQKACDALVLSVELFNRPHDRGRVSSTLIQMDHSFEMLLKAAIVHRGGRIRERHAKETIGFDACVRRALSDGRIRFIIEEQALVLQTLNGLRDAAQHHLLDISEAQLYIHVQSGVTLFRDLLKNVFGQELTHYLPTRVLPVSTAPPMDIQMLFDNEVREIRKLLRPGRRRRLEAATRLRPLAILDGTIRGEKGQPSEPELRKLGTRISAGDKWNEVFQGAASIELSTSGTGPTLSLRLAKREGVPIQLVAEGTPGASVVAVRRVNELDYYNLGATQLANKVGLTLPKTVALVEHLGLRQRADCYKEFKIGSQLHKRYSQQAIREITEALKEQSIDDIWTARRKAGAEP